MFLDQCVRCDHGGAFERRGFGRIGHFGDEEACVDLEGCVSATYPIQNFTFCVCES